MARGYGAVLCMVLATIGVAGAARGDVGLAIACAAVGHILAAVVGYEAGRADMFIKLLRRARGCNSRNKAASGRE